MLVLSRRLNEKVVLPNLNVAVEVLAIKAGAVRLGIDAPPEVTILRDEVLERPGARAGAQPRSPAVPLEGGSNEKRESLADWLKVTSLKLGLARLQLQAGRAEEGQASLEALHEELQFLREHLGGEAKGRANPAVEGGQKAPAFPAHEARRKLLAACAG